MSRRDTAIDYVRSLSPKQLVEFFYEAIAGCDTRRSKKELSHLVLAESVQFPIGSGWETDLLAIPDPDVEGTFADDCIISQSGECGTCGANVMSYAKRVLCPVCGETNYCT